MSQAVGQKKPLEDIYPLSPMQQGMLFHSLYAPRSGVYVSQTSCTLEGDLDAAALRRAWQTVVDRHGVLRTGFSWERRDDPFQVVHRQARLPWDERDWSGLPPEAAEADLRSFLAADRERGFDLGKPPLLRCTLIRLAPGRHRFLWTVHHLLIDGWCLGLLFREVFTFYEAFRRGEELTLPVPRPYRDYIAWLRRQDLALAESWWRRELCGFGAATPLGIERPGKAVTGGHAESEVRLSREETTALRAVAQRHDLTLSTVIQGAWGLLLSRYSGETDVVFGAAMSGRPADLPGVESMVGLFINTLPVRMEVAPETPLLTWLRALQVRLVEMRRFEYSPLVEVQGWSEVPRGRPLFDSLLVFENYPVDRSLAESPLSVRIRDIHSADRTSFPLSLLALPTEELILRLKYDVDRFEPAMITETLQQLAGLCRQIVRSPDLPLADYSLVTPGAPLPDPRQALAEPGFEPVPERIAGLAGSHPGRVAVTRSGREWTYAELVARSEGLARVLLAGGLAPGGVVAVTGERSFGLVASALAVLRAGGVLLTLDGALPEARRALMLERAKASHLLTAGGGLLEKLAAGPLLARLEVDPETGWCAEPSGSGEVTELPAIDPGAPAYLFFTSGTTALPKAILGGHRGLSHFLTWQRETFGVGEGDRCAQLTGLSFDVVLRDLFLPLTSGAVLCLPDAGMDLGPDAVLPWLEREGATRLHAVPAVAASWLEAVPPAASLAALRTVFFAGEPLSDGLVRRWREAFPRAGEIINLYGPTETTLAKCWYRVPARPEPGMQPVGFPLPQTQVLVLAPGDRLCGVGEPGEIAIRTPFRTLGYLDASEEDRRRFVRNPFREGGVDLEEDLLYRTGDRGRVRPDGALELLGRLDDQVKIRGVRVEPSEVAAVLARHPAVRAAVVMSRPDPQGEPGLAAWWVPAEPAAGAAGSGASELRRHLEGLLPPAMVPWAFVPLERLPLTANGKVDRRALPEPECARLEGREALMSPRTPFEEVLAGIWCEVLRRDRIGTGESFFALGGHSLLATQVISRVRRTFGIELPLHELFERPTIEALGARVEDLVREGAGSAAPPLRAVPRQGEIPLSFSQERLWFLDQLEPGSPLYNVQTGVRLTGRLDAGALARSLGEVVRRHEVLRTGFETVGGRAHQVIHPEARPGLPVVDLYELEPGLREAAVRRLGRAAADAPFDLARPPLLRALLVRLGFGEHALLLTVHHIVADAWSIGILIREMAALYRAFTSGAPSPFSELEIQYADFAAWQRGWLRGEALDAEVSWWRRRLAGAPALTELPGDRPRPAIQSFRGTRVSTLLPAALAQELTALAHRSGATLFMVLLAAFQVLLRRASGRDDLVVGTPVANRGRVEVEGLIGFFVNSLVLRTDLGGDPRFAELVSRLRSVLLEGYVHQELPFEKLVESLQPERSLAYNPVFQLMIILQNAASQGETELPDLRLSRLPDEAPAARFDLTLSATDTGGGLFVLADYATDLFDASTVQRLLEHLHCLLAAVVRQPERPLSALPLLTAPERHQLLTEWNDTAEAFPALASEGCLHQLFEVQAGETQEAVALVCEERSWTYGRLEAEANRLAHHLRSLEVGPDVPVGLAVRRSPEMLVGILGILKAGGAYVPLDVEHPRERLAAILDEARVPVLITVEPLVAALPPFSGKTVRLDRDAAQISRHGDAALASGVGPGHLAYVLYTSGSTGQPLGVMVPHGEIVNTLRWRLRAFALDRSDRILQNIPFSFDPSIWQIFGALGSGARLVLPSPDLHRDPASLLGLMADQGVTVTDFPPSFLRALLEHPDFARTVHLRHVFTGGEALPPAVRDRFTALSAATLHNVYGPTEAAIDATLWSCRPGEGLDPVPIGRPMSNKQVLILDRDLRLAPIGVPGELCIAGAGLARGYLGQPERTAGRFVPHPASADPGARIYRTGDLALSRADGSIIFLGRIDHQVKIRGIRIELGEIEAALGQHPEVAEAVVLAPAGESGERRLIAYVVAVPGAQLTAGDITSHLQQRLPQAMIPATFERVEALPRTLAGKVDRQALSRLGGERFAAPQSFVPAQTPRERVLAAIWAEVLRADRVGIEDNFFALGGDSILSIQIVARARQQGLHFTPKQLFQHQTIAELLAAAEAVGPSGVEPEPAPGPVPLTPIQRWFFEAALAEPHHFNQAVLFALRRPLAAGALARAVDTLLWHHPALRLRFRRHAGAWLQETGAPGGPAPFTALDLSALPPDRRSAGIEAASAAAQHSLDLAGGPLLRVVLFEVGSGEPQRLLFLVHHLAIDGVSWRLLVEDLQAAYELWERGEEPRLPPRTASFQRWAERLTVYAGTDAVQRELGFWAGIPPRPGAHLPLDFPAAADDGSETSTETVSSLLEAGETQALLHEIPAAYRTRVNEVLLTALARAFAAWTGERSLLVELEGHGREDLFDDVDLSRTVGWFTSIFPVFLDLDGAIEARDALKAVKEQLRAVPQNGLSYGLLRHMGGAATLLAALPRPEVSFNYLGQFDQGSSAGALLTAAGESAGSVRSGDWKRQHRLEISGLVAGGQLRFQWRYSRDQYRRSTIETLAASYLAELRALIAQGREETADVFTPSDFPLIRADQGQLDRLIARFTHGKERIEDIYPVSPMQQGMLLRSLQEPGSGTYVEQLSCEIEGSLDLGAFIAAWQQVVERHPVLRTAFDWEILDEPVQVVLRQVRLPFQYEDWRGLPAAGREARLESFLRESSERGFDFSSAPLLRVHLFRLEDDLHQLVWNHHHVLLDGWSMPLLFQEAFALYQASRERLDLDLPRPRPFREYIDWLRRQDAASAEAFWRRELAGITVPTPLPVDRPVLSGLPAGELYGDLELWMRKRATASLQTLAQGHRLTLGSIVQGAWGVLLGRLSGEPEVLFGEVVSGRPPDLAGIETMTGLFLNTLPVRVPPVVGLVLPWLTALQARLTELRQLEHSSLVEVQGWSDVPRGIPLFESLVVFESYPLGTAEEARGGGALRLGAHRIRSRTGYPLTLVANPGARLGLKLRYDRRRFSPRAVGELLGQLQTLLEQMAESPELPLAKLSLITPEAGALLPDPAVAIPEPVIPSWLAAFVEIAGRLPEQPAVEQGGRAWTYRELAASSATLAGLLRSRGLAPGEVAAVAGPRSFGLIAAAFGVTRAGGVLLLLDPRLPAERRELMLRQSGARWLIRVGGADQPVPDRPIGLLDIEPLDIEPDTGLPLGMAGEGPPAALAEPLPDDPVYVFFTSGTTGLPKGVLGRHKGLSHFLAWQRRTFAVGPGDRSAQLTGLSFDVVLRDLFTPLTAGATVCLPGPDDEAASPGTPAWLRRERITLLHTVPSLARVWLAASPAVVLDALRCVFFAGEPLTSDLVAAWDAAFGRPAEVINLYGPTETTLAKCWYRVPAEPRSGIQPVGSPLPETQALVLSEEGRPCGLGEPGEIVLRTPFRTLGYLDPGAEEARRFLRNPFRDDPSDLLYRTGDRGRYGFDGLLEILGRLDDQVKIRGLRVEPAEVDRALREHPGIREAAVVAREEPAGEKRLVAYWVPAGPGGPAVEELVAFLRGRLPAAMVPSAFVELAALPLTVNGKLDRTALPAPAGERPALAGRYVMARDAIELDLIGIWEEILGVRPVGVEDDFFNLGGHSLLVLPLLTRVEKRLGGALSVAELLAEPTVAALAQRLRRKPGDGMVRTPLLPLQPRGALPPLFCVHPLGGSALCYQPLASHLGQDQPLYGLDALHLVGQERLYGSLEEMATVYLEALRTVQPRPPYLLAGWSFGGVIAFEIARQLAERGEEVGLLALFDTRAPEAESRKPVSLDEALILRELLGDRIGLSREELEDLGSEGRLRYVIELGKRSGALPGDYDLEAAREVLRIIKMNGTLVGSYVPRLYQGQITFFQAEDEGDAEERVTRWRELAAGGVEVRPVPGPHRELVYEPYVRTLAAELKTALQASQRSERDR
ncbi:MAG TPA: amino acid adenylation domain-containing protein [Thermoanaerobaculia bacterium]|nr:amino acid adenylation domain-containing protein [Thermoanaerobaculia bacterium]